MGLSNMYSNDHACVYVGLSLVSLAFIMPVMFTISEISMLKNICEKCIFPNLQHISMATVKSILSLNISTDRYHI